MTTKRGMADALRAVIASGRNPFAESRGQLLAAITALLDAGAKAGTMRRDVEPGDVLASLSGVSLAAGEPAQREQAGRLLDLLMDGLRYQRPAPPGDTRLTRPHLFLVAGRAAGPARPVPRPRDGNRAWPRPVMGLDAEAGDAARPSWSPRADTPVRSWSTPGR